MDQTLIAKLKRNADYAEHQAKRDRFAFASATMNIDDEQIARYRWKAIRSKAAAASARRIADQAENLAK